MWSDSIFASAVLHLTNQFSEFYHNGMNAMQGFASLCEPSLILKHIITVCKDQWFLVWSCNYSKKQQRQTDTHYISSYIYRNIINYIHVYKLTEWYQYLHSPNELNILCSGPLELTSNLSHVPNYWHVSQQSLSCFSLPSPFACHSQLGQVSRHSQPANNNKYHLHIRMCVCVFIKYIHFL